MEDNTQQDAQQDSRETPPVNRKWRNVYLLVVLFLLLQIALYFLFMKTFE